MVRGAAMIAALVASAGFLSACGIGSRTTATPTSSSVDGEQSQGVSLSLGSSVHEVALSRAKQSVRDGKYDVAEGQFERLAATVEAGPDLRAQALMELGALQRNVLNPGRDSSRALQTYRRLVDEFPDSPLRSSAQLEIERLEAP
jgi:hypothetical protein